MISDSATLSVAMPVRNGLPYLDECIKSILAQTHRDFEFVICDDGSTDGTTEALQEWAKRDSRIRLHRREGGLGPAGSSNWVVSQCSAPIIARMDADDISDADRFRRQLKVLADDPETMLVGSLWRGIDSEGRSVRSPDRWRLSRTSPFAPFPHGSAMFRREAFDAVGGYRSECDFWEDLDLFLRFASRFKVVVLPDVLYSHRLSPASTRLTSHMERVENKVDLMYRCIDAYRSTGSYEHLLKSDGMGGGGRLRPETFMSIGSNRIWAGLRAHALRRLWKRGDLSFDRATLTAIPWAIWGDVSPKSLRLCLSTLVSLRDRRVRDTFAEGTPYRWDPSVRT